MSKYEYQCFISMLYTNSLIQGDKSCTIQFPQLMISQPSEFTILDPPSATTISLGP